MAATAQGPSPAIADEDNIVHNRRTDQIERIVRKRTFAQIPDELTFDARVSPLAYRLYAVLDRYAGQDGRAWPSRERLARDLRSVDSRGELKTPSRATVARALACLVDTGWIVRVQRTPTIWDTVLCDVPPDSVPVDNRSDISGASARIGRDDSLVRRLPTHQRDACRLTGETQKENQGRDSQRKGVGDFPSTPDSSSPDPVAQTEEIDTDAVREAEDTLTSVLPAPVRPRGRHVASVRREIAHALRRGITPTALGCLAARHGWTGATTAGAIVPWLQSLTADSTPQTHQRDDPPAVPPPPGWRRS